MQCYRLSLVKNCKKLQWIEVEILQVSITEDILNLFCHPFCSQFWCVFDDFLHHNTKPVLFNVVRVKSCCHLWIHENPDRLFSHTDRFQQLPFPRPTKIPEAMRTKTIADTDKSRRVTDNRLNFRNNSENSSNSFVVFTCYRVYRLFFYKNQ